MEIVRSNTDNLQKDFLFFNQNYVTQDKNLPADLKEAITDSRKKRNLHGPFKSAKEAVMSMLENWDV